MPPEVSCIILSGGLNSRYSGQNKAFVRIGGVPVIERLLNTLSPLFDEIIIVTNDPGRYLDYDALIVTDIYNVRSSLTGIHAGLFAMNSPYGFVTACDMPFLNPGVVRLLLDAVNIRYDVVIPETSRGLEPLCAVYSRACKDRIGNRIENNKLKIDRLFRKLNVKKISEPALRSVDPDLDAFFNINRPDDRQMAEKKIDTERKHGNDTQ